MMKFDIPDKYLSFLRFCIVGGCAAGVHYGIYYLLLLCNAPINAAYITGYLISFVGNFFATSYFTFRSKPSWTKFIGFSGSHAINFILHIILLNLFLWLGMHKLIAPIAVMAVAMLIQYAILHWVYKPHKKNYPNYVLMSLDTEEFDLPREQGVDIDFKKQIEVAEEGTNIVLDIFKETGIKATFFCTTNFAQNAPETFKRIIDEGHEIASHACDHFNPQPDDIEKSKDILQQLSNKDINGYRQPRMLDVPEQKIEDAGYLYNSSLHPAFIPGRYMHLDVPRLPFMKGKVLQIPTSVTPHLRLPVFWLACHNYPLYLYLAMCQYTLNYDGLFVIYFHPYEFTNLHEHKEWKIPFIIKRNAGKNMQDRLRRLIKTLQQEQAQFITYTEFTQHYLKNEKENNHTAAGV